MPYPVVMRQEVVEETHWLQIGEKQPWRED